MRNKPSYLEMKKCQSYFAGRQAVLGTKHGKEQVIAPLLRDLFGMETLVPRDFDTDCYGTFTREIPRLTTQLETARQKAQAAMAHTDLTLGLASEGSFGPHPDAYFLPCNLEIVVLIDREHDLEIVGQSLTTNVRLVHGYVTHWAEALELAKRAGFPEHHLVVRAHEHSNADLHKGISTYAALEEAVLSRLREPFARQVFIESDLRAHCHPTRMANIRQATLDLISNLQRCCPRCGEPGFVIRETKVGLPCRWCGSPTMLPLAQQYGCCKCHYSELISVSNQPEWADPGHCAFCNP